MEFSRSSLGHLSEFSRWNEARYKRTKREGNLKKSTFWVVGSSLGVPWFLSRPRGSNDYSFFGSSLVFSPREIGKVQGKIILIKRTFPDIHNITKSAGKGGTTS